MYSMIDALQEKLKLLEEFLMSINYVINELFKQELVLTLTNKFEGLANDNSSDMKTLFVRIKRMVVDLLRVQPGDNLTQIMLD